ncbi:unnamed protein product [Caretta caretta]
MLLPEVLSAAYLVTREGYKSGAKHSSTDAWERQRDPVMAGTQPGREQRVTGQIKKRTFKVKGGDRESLTEQGASGKEEREMGKATRKQVEIVEELPE